MARLSSLHGGYALITQEQEEGDRSTTRKHINDTICRSCIWHGCLCLTTLTISTLLCLSGLMLYLQSTSNSAATRHISTTRGLEEIAHTYHSVQFEGGIYLDTPFKGPPSEEVDAAWEALTPMSVFQVGRDDIIRAGGSEASVRFGEEYGGGYQAYLELPHQIHCLYKLWTNTWPSYYNSTANGSEDPESILRKHIDHCADLLRQKLLCDADPTIITYNYVKHLSHPTPNFNTRHQCRNATAVYEWLNEHKVNLPKEAFKKPANAIELNTFP